MTTPVATSPAPSIDRAALEQRVADLSLYSDAGDAVSDGEIWYVPETADVFGADGFTFDDFLDVINPLHHLPVIGTLYRAITDDEIAPASRVVGGALFGGIAGFVAGLVNAVIEDETGSDLGEKALALVGFDDEPTAVAQASPAAQQAANKTGPAPSRDAIASSILPAAAGAAAIQPGPSAQPPKSATTLGAVAHAAVPTVSPHAAGKLVRAPAAPAPAQAAKPPAATAGIAGFALTGKVAAPRAALPVTTPAIQSDTRTAQATPIAADHGNSRLAAQAAPAVAVPKLMRDALDKYDVLMRDRRPPTVSQDF